MRWCRTRRSSLRWRPSLFQRAQELAGGDLSAAIATALQRFVDAEEARTAGYDQVTVASASGPGTKVRFSANLVGEWADTTKGRVEHYRVYRGRKRQVRPPRRAQRRLLDGGARASRPGGAAISGSETFGYGGVPGIHPRGRRHPRRAPREGPAGALRHGRPRVPSAGRRGPRHLTTAGVRAAGGRHDGRHRHGPLRVRRLRKSYGKQVVLDGIDLDVAEGSVFALLGPEWRRQDDDDPDPDLP